MQLFYTLRGEWYNKKLGKYEDLEHYFTHNERALALQVAKRWHLKGWKPFLVSFDGENWEELYNFRTKKMPMKKKRFAA